MSGLKKSKKSTIISAAEKVVEKRLEENQVEDLQKIGALWSIMLELDTPMLPSQAAAMLCVSDLVRATTLIDSEKHWIEAAVFAIIGAHADETSMSNELSTDGLLVEVENEHHQIGFAATLNNRLQ
jgi:hypothetical protein